MKPTSEAPEKLHPLRAWRKAQEPKLTLRQLAAELARRDDAAAVSYATLARIEQGRIRPSFDLLLALLEISGGALALEDWVPAEVRARLRGRSRCGATEARERTEDGQKPARDRVIKRAAIT